METFGAAFQFAKQAIKLNHRKIYPFDMFDQSYLEEIMETVIRASAMEAVEDRDAELIHLDFEVFEMTQPVRIEGRAGIFIKFSFDYELEYLSSEDLDEEEDYGRRKFRQTVRLNSEGKLAAWSERQELS